MRKQFVMANLTHRTAAKQTGATRRRLLKGGLAAALAAPMINSGQFKVFAQSQTTYSARTIELIERLATRNPTPAPLAGWRERGGECGLDGTWCAAAVPSPVASCDVCG